MWWPWLGDGVCPSDHVGMSGGDPVLAAWMSRLTQVSKGAAVGLRGRQAGWLVSWGCSQPAGQPVCRAAPWWLHAMAAAPAATHVPGVGRSWARPPQPPSQGEPHKLSVFSRLTAPGRRHSALTRSCNRHNTRRGTLEKGQCNNAGCTLYISYEL